MLFNVPQFIDKEDKIVGPLTAKQLGWLAGAGVTMLILFGFLDMTAFVMASIPVLGIFGALAFYRPNNQPLISFVFSSISFLFRPKMYIWRRLPEKIETPQKHKQEKIEAVKEKKIVNENKLSEISKLLDQNKK